MSEQPRGRERRSPRRIRVLGPVRGSLGLRGSARVLDLSTRGAKIEHGGPLAPDEPVVLTLHLARVNLRLPARIAWTQVHRREAGPRGEEEQWFRSGIQFREEAAGRRNDPPALPGHPRAPGPGLGWGHAVAAAEPRDLLMAGGERCADGVHYVRRQTAGGAGESMGTRKAGEAMSSSATGQRMCAWCGTDLGPATVIGDGVTYGICETCLEREKAKLEAGPAKSTPRDAESGGTASR